MNLIPSPDPLGLPAPAWFLITLMVVTQALHIVFMNFVLGGSWFLVWTAMGAGDWKRSLSARCLNIMPVALSLAITFGIAPLLFVQVLYGQFFYVSNVLLGWFWLAILALVMIAFYLVYMLKPSKPAVEPVSNPVSTWFSPGLRLAVHLVAAVCFTGVAFLYTTNAVLSQHPDIWAQARVGHPIQTVWSSVALVAPRFLHNVVGALVITGLWVVWIAALRGEGEEKEKGARAGVQLALGATFIQMILGFWYLLSLPSEVLKGIMTFHSMASISLFLGVVLAVGLAMHLVFLLQAPLHARYRVITSGLAAGVLLMMTITNQGLRQDLLAKYFTTAQWDVQTQWGPVLLFLVLFLAGVGTVLWIAKVAWSAHSLDSAG
jgi:hypothetical protein